MNPHRLPPRPTLIRFRHAGSMNSGMTGGADLGISVRHSAAAA
ncbi:hypothetical protein [Streptomyces sp. NPDC046821]